MPIIVDCRVYKSLLFVVVLDYKFVFDPFSKYSRNGLKLRKYVSYPKLFIYKAFSHWPSRKVKICDILLIRKFRHKSQTLEVRRCRNRWDFSSAPKLSCLVN